MTSDVPPLRKPLPRLPKSVPRAVRALCYAVRRLPRGYAKLYPTIAALAPSLHSVTLHLEDVGSFSVDFRESICAALLARGCYEHQLPLDQLLDRLLIPGMTVFDLGANIGYCTKFISSRIGAMGKVIAVEPMPRALSLLRKNSSHGVIIVPMAIGSSLSEAVLQEKWDLDVSFVKFGKNGGGDRVQVATIDWLTEMYGCPNLIKLDVEGSELAAFDGGLATLRSADPPIVCFEYIAKNAMRFGSYQLDDLLVRLSPSHEVFKIVEPGSIAKLSSTAATSDYLAIPHRVVSEVSQRLVSTSAL